MPQIVLDVHHGLEYIFDGKKAFEPEIMLEIDCGGSSNGSGPAQ